MPNTNPLDVNQPIANLIVLSDIFGSGKGFIEGGNEPSSSQLVGSTHNSFERGKARNYSSLIVRGEDVAPLFPQDLL